MTNTDVAQVQPADLALSDDTVRRLRDAISPNTRRAYEADWRTYTTWCEEVERTTLPASAETLTEFAAALARRNLAPKTISRMLGTVRAAHRAADLHPPSSTGQQMIIRQHRRERAGEGIRAKKAAPLMLESLRAMAYGCDTTKAAGVRDRALVVMGFAMMARRSELVALDLSDLRFTPDGVAVLLRMSKPDQDAFGDTVALPYGSAPETCPVRTLQAWLKVLHDRGLTAGPLWRSIDKRGRLAGEPKYAGRAKSPRLTDKSVGLILRRLAVAAGVDLQGLSAHSLRAGGATEVYRVKRDVLAIARHGRWADGSPVLLDYIREVDKWQANAMSGIGL